MQDGRSRITVVGERKRIDVGVPTAAPIGEYVAGLAEACGQSWHGVMPPAWSLARAGTPALPLGASLAEAGIADGQVLYLHDLTRDPGAAPVVDDIDELVIGEAQRLRDHGPPRGLGLIVVGIAWLAVAAAFFFASRDGQVIPASVSLVCGGLLLLSTAWALELRRAGVSSALCLGMALVSMPCFAIAGAMLAEGLAGSGYLWIGGVIGANAGAILTLVATPEAVVFAVWLPCAVAGIVVPVLVAVHANAEQSAAAVVVTALGLISLARPTAAGITLLTRRMRTSGGGHPHITTETLIQTRRLIAVVVLAPVIATAISVVILVRSGSVFSLILATVVTVWLAVRARQSVVRLETALLGGGSAWSLFVVLATVVVMVPGAWWGPVLLVAVGLLQVGIGVVSTVAADPAHPGGEPAELGPPRRRAVDTLGTVCSVLSAPLALGAFGVFDQLVAIGRGILH